MVQFGWCGPRLAFGHKSLFYNTTSTLSQHSQPCFYKIKTVLKGNQKIESFEVPLLLTVLLCFYKKAIYLSLFVMMPFFKKANFLYLLYINIAGNNSALWGKKFVIDKSEMTTFAKLSW